MSLSGRSSRTLSDKIGLAPHHPPPGHRRRKPAAHGHHRPHRLQRDHPRPARHRRRPPEQPHRDDQRERLGLADVEADIIGRSYEYLIRKFAEGGGQSAGELRPPGEVGEVMALIMDPQPGMAKFTTPPAVPPASSSNASSRSTRWASPRALKTLRPGVDARDVGHGQHEHDHPRHGG